MEKVTPKQIQLPPQNKTTLNRRYAKLKELIEGDSDYFTEEQIQHRDVIQSTATTI